MSGVRDSDDTGKEGQEKGNSKETSIERKGEARQGTKQTHLKSKAFGQARTSPRSFPTSLTTPALPEAPKHLVPRVACLDTRLSVSATLTSLSSRCLRAS